MSGGLLRRLRTLPGVRRLGVELPRYAAVSMVNALLTFLVFTFMLKIVQIHYLGALFISWLCGMVFSYCLNFVWVFAQPDRLKFDFRFFKFAVTGSASICMNMIALRFLVEISTFDPFWVQTALIPPVVAFNFLAAKFWSLVRVDG